MLIIVDPRRLPRCSPAIVLPERSSSTIAYTFPDITSWLIFKALTDRETRVLARSSSCRRDERASQGGGDETGESTEQIIAMRTRHSIETMSER